MKYIKTFIDRFKSEEKYKNRIYDSGGILYEILKTTRKRPNVSDPEGDKKLEEFKKLHIEKNLTKSHLNHLNKFLEKDWIFDKFTSKLDSLNSGIQYIRIICDYKENTYQYSAPNGAVKKYPTVSSGKIEISITLFDDDWYIVNINNRGGRGYYTDIYYKCDTMEGVEQVLKLESENI